MEAVEAVERRLNSVEGFLLLPLPKIRKVNMEQKKAEALARNLRRKGWSSGYHVSLWASVEEGRIEFSGGLWGSASIDLQVSSRERVLAHWDGYCAAHGLKSIPEVGQSAQFALGSRNTLYIGKVLKASPLRTTVEFRYNYGRKATRELRTADLTAF